MPETQSYPNHRAFDPIFHFFAVPVLVINVIVHLVIAVMNWRVWQTWWGVVVAVALVALAWSVRIFAVKLQDRIIRTEEILRLQRVLPPELRDRINELTIGNLIALRFCADDELPELTRAVLGGEVRKREEIKRRIRNWRPDLHRV